MEKITSLLLLLILTQKYQDLLNLFDAIRSGHFPTHLLPGMREAFPGTLDLVMGMTSLSPDERPTASVVYKKVLRLIDRQRDEEDTLILCDFEEGSSPWSVCMRVMRLLRSPSLEPRPSFHWDDMQIRLEFHVSADQDAIVAFAQSLGKLEGMSCVLHNGVKYDARK